MILKDAILIRLCIAKCEEVSLQCLCSCLQDIDPHQPATS